MANSHLFPIPDSTLRNPTRMVKLAAISKLTGSCEHIVGTIFLSWPLWIYSHIGSTFISRALGQ